MFSKPTIYRLTKTVFLFAIVTLELSASSITFNDAVDITQRTMPADKQIILSHNSATKTATKSTFYISTAPYVSNGMHQMHPNFKEFFRVDETENFIHNNDVSNFLNLICKQNKESNFPFATQEYRDNFRHSLWMVPGVKEARALSALLKSHSVFSHFEIVNVAGDGDADRQAMVGLTEH